MAEHYCANADHASASQCWPGMASRPRALRRRYRLKEPSRGSPRSKIKPRLIRDARTDENQLTLAAGYSTSIEMLTLLRLVGGLGFGALYPNAFALLAEISPPSARARIVVIASVGTPVGGMLGAIATGWALPQFGWRATSPVTVRSSRATPSLPS